MKGKLLKTVIAAENDKEQNKFGVHLDYVSHKVSKNAEGKKIGNKNVILSPCETCIRTQVFVV